MRRSLISPYETADDPPELAAQARKNVPLNTIPVCSKSNDLPGSLTGGRKLSADRVQGFFKLPVVHVYVLSWQAKTLHCQLRQLTSHCKNVQTRWFLQECRGRQRCLRAARRKQPGATGGHRQISLSVPAPDPQPAAILLAATALLRRSFFRVFCLFSPFLRATACTPARATPPLFSGALPAGGPVLPRQLMLRGGAGM